MSVAMPLYSSTAPVGRLIYESKWGLVLTGTHRSIFGVTIGE